MNDELVLGQGLAVYQSHANLNTLINSLYPVHRAFQRGAVITQQKQIPDVSYYQGLIEWDIFRSQTDAVIIRAGQNTWVDEYFLINWAEAKARGMLRGVYFFYDGRVDPGRQAALLVGLIQNDLPEMEVWIDWEYNYKGSFEGLQNVVAMMQRVEQLLPGVKVGIYTGYYWFIGNSNAITNVSQYAYLKTHPLWLAWYTNDAGLVRVPQPWADLDWWQWGTPSLGSNYGVATKEIDMNFPNMTEAEFYATYGGSEPPPDTGDTMPEFKVVTAVSYRSSPSTANTSNLLGTLQVGDVVTGTLIIGVNDPVTQWVHFSQIMRVNGTVQMVDAYCSGYIKYVQLITPPPTDGTTTNVTFEWDTSNTLTGITVDGAKWVKA